MEVFVERATTYEKCLKKIREKYGDGVTVVRQKGLKIGGVFGFFEKEGIELSFTLDTVPVQKQSHIPTYSVSINHSEPSYSKHSVVLDDAEERSKILNQLQSSSPHLSKKIGPIIKQQEDNKKLKEKESVSLENIEEIVKNVVGNYNKQGSYSSAFDTHPTIEKFTQILEENDFTASYIKKVTKRLREELSFEILNDPIKSQMALLDCIAESLVINLPVKKDDTRIIVLIGPTGVGKTTTLAKLAAFYHISESRNLAKALKVRVITIDNYRIGATHQIGKYCEHMALDLTVAEKPQDFHKFMDLYRDECDVICIDTTGRSPNDYEKIAEMQRYFSLLEDDAETYLVISASTKTSDIREIMKQYKVFSYQSVIISKFDETLCSGNLISVLDEANLSVSYVTTGQNVPKDFKKASKGLFLKKLKGFSIPSEDFIQKYDDSEDTIIWR